MSRPFNGERTVFSTNSIGISSYTGYPHVKDLPYTIYKKRNKTYLEPKKKKTKTEPTGHTEENPIRKNVRVHEKTE